MIWTDSAKDLLREASAKAESMNHPEVHPLHLLWAATGRTGLNALRLGKSDHRQARLRFQVERDLKKLTMLDQHQDRAPVTCATPGARLQRLLLRAADLAATATHPADRGSVGLPELMMALMQDDHRATSLLRAVEGQLTVSA
jgi:ATP-dependent Clp protease ATP-binding subunit ClpA